MISRIDHIAIAVDDFQGAQDFFSKIMGLIPGASAEDHNLGFFWQVFSAGDLSRLELLTPSGKKSFLDSFLKKKRGGVHHLTLETPDIEIVRRKLDELDIPYFGYSTESPDWKELFIHPRDAYGILIQIGEFPPQKYLDPSQTIKEGRKWTSRKTTDGCLLTVAHPGGGKVDISLSASETEALIEELQTLL